MEEAYEEIRGQGAEILAISTDDIGGAQRMQQTVGATFPVLADPTRATAEAYRVFDLLGDGVAAPATFIVDADSLIAVHVGSSIGDRPSAASLLHTLRQYNDGELTPGLQSG